MTLLVAPVALAACGQGNGAATYVQATQGATGDGVEQSSANGLLGIRGAVVVAKDGNFSIVTTLVNNGMENDALVAVGVGTGATSVHIDIPAGRTVSVGQIGAPEHIFGTGLMSKPSAFVPVTFVFAKGGDITAKLLVRSPDGYWAGIRVKK